MFPGDQYVGIYFPYQLIMSLRHRAIVLVSGLPRSEMKYFGAIQGIEFDIQL